MFLKIGVLKSFTIFTGKHQFPRLFLKPATLLKKLQHRYFPENIANCFRIACFRTAILSGISIDNFEKDSLLLLSLNK